MKKILLSCLVFIGFFCIKIGTGKASFLEKVPLSDENWYLVILGFVLVGIGLLGFCLLPQKKELSPDTKICPRCETVYDHKPRQDEKCPKCESKLEELKGFYDRHPEKRL